MLHGLNINQTVNPMERHTL